MTALLWIAIGLFALALLSVLIILLVATSVARAFTTQHDEDTDHEMINRKVP